MQQQKYYIKGMVCDRCIAAVKETLKNLDIEVLEVNLGDVTLLSPVIEELQMEERLKLSDFSLLQNKQQKLVKEAKALVAEVYSGHFDFGANFRFYRLASEKLYTSYKVIKAAFAASEHTSLEKYIIDFRIQKIKELLVYTNNPVADIAFRLGFSSVAHLSGQFKTHTGLTPSYFKNIKAKKHAVQVAATANNYINQTANNITVSELA